MSKRPIQNNALPLREDKLIIYSNPAAARWFSAAPPIADECYLTLKGPFRSTPSDYHRAASRTADLFSWLVEPRWSASVLQAALDAAGWYSAAPLIGYLLNAPRSRWQIRIVLLTLTKESIEIESRSFGTSLWIVGNCNVAKIDRGRVCFAR